MQPLILTLALDEQSQNFFNEQRRLYFPPERNYLDAHLTLFHNLPAGEEKIHSVIDALCKEQFIIDLKVNEVRNIGSGVAYKIESPVLMQLHKHLQQEWQPWLIPQDQHKLWPHITIQNKVEPAIANTLHTQLAEAFKPFTTIGTGLNLWEYLGGPWKFIRHYGFEG